MAIFFTLLFIVTAYITPTVLFGPLAEYHVEVLLAMLALGFSAMNVLQSRLEQTPQTYAFAGLCMSIPLSLLVSGWLGGAAEVLYGFLPVVFCFVLPAANFRKVVHFRWLVVLMVLCSAYFMYNGLHDLYNHVIPSDFIYGDGELRRIRGLGFVKDPNDLAQVLVSLLPLLFLWRRRSWLLTTLVLLPPIALLVTGMYYTHSRGGALALMAVLIIALRRKVGTVPAVVLAGGLFFASLAVGWSGGRDVSVEAGGDRLDAWSVGLELIRHHPFFGVGINKFSDFNDVTAHNSVVVCAAEIGLPAFICWTFMVFASFRNLIAVSGWKPDEEGESQEPALTRGWPATARLHVRPLTQALPRGSTPYLQYAQAAPVPVVAVAGAAPFRFGRAARGQDSAIVDVAAQLELQSIARILVCSLTGFLVAGWFLSRALSMWLFLYCGLSLALVRMAEAAGMQVRRDSFAFLAKWSVLLSIVLLLLVYAILRFRSLTGH